MFLRRSCSSLPFAVVSRESLTSLSPSTSVLVYPVRETTGVVSITHGDTKRLQDGEFLNDTLIEFGLK